MGPITSILPVVRVVSLAGRTFEVAEFTLRDLAYLQSVLDEADLDPMEEYEAASATPGIKPRAKHAALVAAYERAERGPALYGKAAGNAYFSTPQGAALFLWVALKRKNEVTPQESAQLFMACSAVEFSRVWRLAHGVTSVSALERMLMGALPPREGQAGGREKTWAEMIDEVSRERGWTYSQIYDLTITEWIAARNWGSLPNGDQVLNCSVAEACKIAEAQGRRYRGEDIIDLED